MKKTATNILKASVGRMQVTGHADITSGLSWFNTKVLKHQEDKLIKTLQLGHLKVFYRRPYELLHAYTEIFQHGIYRFRTNATNPLIIDCGANIGFGVLNFKTQYPNATVIAFEPDADNFALLQRNVTANNFSQIRLHQAAVWNANGTITFASEGSEASHIATDGKDGQQVAATRLADVLSEHKKIDFLKVDIEGAEWQVVVDCAAYLHKVDNLFLEYHGKTGETGKLADIMNILNEAGYAVYVQHAANNLKRPFLQRTTQTIYDVQLNLFCFKEVVPHE